jgi:hypothetical protein
MDDAIEHMRNELPHYQTAEPPPSESPPPDEHRQDGIPDSSPDPGPQTDGSLDMSSAEAFIDDVSAIYGIILTDEHELLSGPEGGWLMEEIGRCLILFSPGFITRLVSMYAGHESGFYIRLDSPSDDEFGSIVWDDDLIIYLRYDSNPDENGVTAATLAHELGHAIHFMAEEIVGEEQIENEMKALNGDFEYAGDRHHTLWDERIHRTAFAYNYGMFDHYEDIATIVELLADDPEDMRARLNDPENGILRRKTEYIRYLTSYITADIGALFAPLELEEPPGELPGAA